MNNLLIGINAKYIHPNMAIRLLKANAFFPVEIKEWTIKDKPQIIANYLLANSYTLIGFSCYIWNIELIKEVLLLLKQNKFRGKIILGGPEVSYENEEFFDIYSVDYIIVDEGEIAFHLLLKAIYENSSLQDIPNLHTKNFKNSSVYIKNLDLLANPYFDLDFPNQIMYLETSRGCPFKCSYCMASLEARVRYFNLDIVKKNLAYLFSKGAKTFKFLDRTFNIDIARAKDLFTFIINNAPLCSSFQFEIVADLLTSDLINYLNENVPKGLFRFEIGIQSLNETTNLLVGRKQNKKTLLDNIKLIESKKIIDLHLDLIAGLPNENLNEFKKSFDEVINLRPLELQLGFLKLLKGTRIYLEASKYNYKWQKKAPFEIIENSVLKAYELEIIRIVENVCEKYYNSHFMDKTIHYLLDQEKSSFDFFYRFGTFYQSSYAWFGYNLHDLFIRLYEYLKNNNPNHEYILFLMKQDYLAYFNIKPMIWWNRLSKNIYNKRVEILSKTKLSNFSLQEIFLYGHVEEYGENGILVLYKLLEKQTFVW